MINFPEEEKKTLDWWYSSGVIDKYLHKNDQSDKKFRFLDGPITANNPMGVHHAWGRTYKDLWQRYFNMQGCKQRFQNGFDCQGLWVEVEVEKELGLKNKKDIENIVPGDKKTSIDRFVNLCKERVNKFSSIQTEQSKRLGYFMDWDNSYYTNSDANNYMIWYFLKKCHEKGLLYKGHDSVPWCYRCGIAISQHEILTEDYQEITHETVYFKLPIVGQEKTYLLVWTTTPWTIPANVAVAVNTKETYVKVKCGQDLLILMKKRYEVLKEDFRLGEIVEELTPQSMIGWKYEGAFDDLPAATEARKDNEKLFHVVISGLLWGDELVTSVEGTGLLHVAPGAGEEDYQLGKQLGLPSISLIDEDANYYDGMGEFSHLNAKVNPGIIINYLKNKEAGRFLLATRNYLHRYPVCWRCKTELVWRIVDEWYIKMSDELRENMRKVVRSIKWIPEFGLERELDWISNMHDWLISKKRYYGLCLPIYECEKCHTFEVVESYEDLKEKAVEGWKEFEGHSPHRPWVDKVKIKCGKCGSVLSRIPDVGNVWLDAGIVTFSTVVDPESGKVSYMNDKKYFQDWFPVDFITESFPGQFKNWFYSLLVMSTVWEGHEAFKTVLGFASLLGEDGKPMHKSNKKTFVSFDDGADKIGVDVLRWLYVTNDPTHNLLFGFKVGDEVRRKFHLMLWNIFNFFLTYASLNQNLNLDDKSQNVLDIWIKTRLVQVKNVVTKSLDSFDAFTASTEIEKFVSDLSLWYVRRSRDRVDGDKSCLPTLYQVLSDLSKLLAPFLPFISERMYQTLKAKKFKLLDVSEFKVENSVHLSSWPVMIENVDEELLKNMQLTRQLVEAGHSVRKSLGIKVRQPLQKFTISNIQYSISNELQSLLKDELNVKEVEFINGEGELKVEFDTNLTQELKDEGEARGIVRMIQEERKRLGCGLKEEVEAILPSWPESFSDYIKKETLVNKIEKGDFAIIRK